MILSKIIFVKFQQKIKNWQNYYQGKTKWRYIEAYMAKVMINILQGSVATQTVLGSLTILPPITSPIANFL